MTEKESLGGNPIADGVSVSVTVPSEITIRMVDASTLNDYEMWVFLASAGLSFLSGFVVATIQAFGAGDRLATPLCFMCIALLIAVAAFGWKALTVRSKITAPGKSINLVGQRNQ